MTRKKPYNKAVNYVITLNGEYHTEKEKLLNARRYVRNMRTEKNTTVHIIRQVVTETVIDVFKPILKPTWTIEELDLDL